MIGIYKITNKINGKVYIGQSWDIERRWKEHKKKDRKKHLYSAFQKYGMENFCFEVIKELRETPLTQILLDEYEIFYIKQFDSFNAEKGYNKTTGGSSGKRSEEFKILMSNKMKGNKNNLGNKRSKETKALQSKKRVGIKLTEEHKKNIGLSSLGRKPSNSKKTVCIETTEIFESASEASRKMKIGLSHIARVCRGIRKTAGGYHFKYYEESA